MHNNIRIELIIVHLLVYNYRLSRQLNTRIVLESGQLIAHRLVHVCYIMLHALSLHAKCCAALCYQCDPLVIIIVHVFFTLLTCRTPRVCISHSGLCNVVESDEFKHACAVIALVLLHLNLQGCRAHAVSMHAVCATVQYTVCYRGARMYSACLFRCVYAYSNMSLLWHVPCFAQEQELLSY